MLVLRSASGGELAAVRTAVRLRIELARSLDGHSNGRQLAATQQQNRSLRRRGRAGRCCFAVSAALGSRSRPNRSQRT